MFGNHAHSTSNNFDMGYHCVGMIIPGASELTLKGIG